MMNIVQLKETWKEGDVQATIRGRSRCDKCDTKTLMGKKFTLTLSHKCHQIREYSELLSYISLDKIEQETNGKFEKKEIF